MHELVDWNYKSEDGLHLRGKRTLTRGLPVIFFLHGNGLCSMTYWPMLRHLSSSFDLVLLDAPGHGASDPLARFQGWAEDAQRCHAAWQSLAAEYADVDCHVVAHSYGGVLATYFLADNPGSFQSGVLLDPVYFPPRMLALGRLLDFLGLLGFHKLARMTRKRRFRWPSRDAAKQHLGARGIYAKWEAACLDAYLAHGLRPCDDGVGVRLRCDRELEAGIFGSLPFQLPAKVAILRTRCVAISGDRSYGFVQRGLPHYSAGHAYLQHLEIPGSHNFMLEQTHETANRVEQALTATRA